MSKPSVRPPLFAELTRRTPPPPPPPAADPIRGSDALEAVREGHRIAHAIIARAEAQAQEISAAAREQGLETGRRQGLEQVSGELKSAAAALEAAAQKLEETRQRLQAEVTAELPRAAVEIAERILRQELSLRPDALVRVVRDAVAAVTPAQRVEVKLHAEDLAILERHRALLADVLGGAELRLEAAPGVRKGGCLVETEAVTLAAGIVDQLERALALLGGAR